MPRPRKNASSKSDSASQESLDPVPVFYCAYLLRSTVRHASLYIGSTPNPARRLAQHNGEIEGGAKRTHRDNLRPWEMVMIVSGFTSRVAALQFEWAWQNTRNSRHADYAYESSRPGVRICPRTGKPFKRSGRHQLSLLNIMTCLHILLRAPYFSAWPLNVRFFSPDVHRVWEKCCQQLNNFISDSIEVVVDENTKRADRQTPINSLDIKNSSLEEYFDKANFFLDNDERILCEICKQALNLQNDLVVLCSYTSCNHASHVTCLASKLLESELTPTKIVPSTGQCPGCSSTIVWSTLMKELTWRIRGTGKAKPGQSKGRRKGAKVPKTSTENRSCADRQYDYLCPESLDVSDESPDDGYPDTRLSTPRNKECEEFFFSSPPREVDPWSDDISEPSGWRKTAIAATIDDTWDDMIIVD